MPQPRTTRRSRPTAKDGPSPDLTDASRGVRLQRVLAMCGVASRRACEAIIEAGHVSVNGHVVTHLPVWVDPQQDRIDVDGQRVRVDKDGSRTPKRIVIMVNKPRNVVSTNRDELGRTRVIDLVDARERLFPVGRLDADSTGLILLTNDGQLANRLTHPSFGVAKTYRVRVRGRLNEDDVTRLRNGLMLTQRRARGSQPVRRAAMSEVRVLSRTRDKRMGESTNLVVTLREGQNREIRRLLARLNFKVRRLERIAIGALQLKGLARGQWRRLSASEIRALQRATRAS